MGKRRAHPAVRGRGDPLKRLAFPGEILAYPRDVLTAHRVESHGQHDVVSHTRSPPREHPEERLHSARRCAQKRSSGWVAVDPDTLNIASAAALIRVFARFVRVTGAP